MLSIGGMYIEVLVDPRSSATIILFKCFKKVGLNAKIPWEALQKLDIMFRNCSRRPTPIFVVVNLESD